MATPFNVKTLVTSSGGEGPVENTSLCFNPAALEEIIQLEETGDTGLLQSLIGDYTTSSLLTYATLKKAITENDFASLELHAHSLKSSSLLLGLETCGDICRALEDDARYGKANLQKMDLLLPELQAAIAQLVQFKWLKSA